MLPIDEWKRISAEAGMKGERQCDWARISLGEAKEGQQRWLMFRRGIGEKAEIAYYTVSVPEKISLEEIVKVSGTRWAIEESFESAKGEVGLDHYEVRSWDGWYRLIALSMLAHAYLTVVRAYADDKKRWDECGAIGRSHPADRAGSATIDLVVSLGTVSNPGAGSEVV